jgi:hypothetical protein
VIMRIFLAAVAAFALAGAAAQAAIVQTYTTSVDFLADFPVPAADTVTFGPVGAGPLIDLIGSAASAGAGLVTITASPGNLFGDSTIVSTEIENETLLVTFSQPLEAVGLSALITDDVFGAIGGVLLIEAVGSGDQNLTVTDAGPSFIGLRSDVAFTSLRISVDSFDQNASAVAFASLTNTIFAARDNDVAVPAPGIAALLLPMAALALLRRRAAQR